jgi:hypothetical protein
VVKEIVPGQRMPLSLRLISAQKRAGRCTYLLSMLRLKNNLLDLILTLLQVHTRSPGAHIILFVRRTLINVLGLQGLLNLHLILRPGEPDVGSSCVVFVSAGVSLHHPSSALFPSSATYGCDRLSRRPSDLAVVW